MMVKIFTKPDAKRQRTISNMYNYLLGRDRNRKHARLLLGDVDLSKRLIHQYQSENKFTSGCLSFTETNIPENQKYELMHSFEKSLLCGLDADQYNIVWIEHRDKNRLELNFVIANQELRTGKRLQPYWDGIDRPLVENWKLVQNQNYGFTEPNDPERRKIVAHSNESPKTVNELRDQATNLVLDAHINGQLRSRDDVLNLLKSHNYEIARESKKSISLKNPFNPSAKNIRLEGRLFDRDFDGNLVNAELKQKHAENLAKSHERLSRALAIKQAENHQKYGPGVIPGSDFVNQLLEQNENEADKRISSSIRFDDEQLEELTQEISRSEFDFRNRKQLSNSRESDIERAKQAIAESKQAIEQSKQRIERVPQCLDVKRTRVINRLNDLSNTYWKFERFYNDRVSQRDTVIHELENRFNKSQKWLNKKNFDEDYIDQYKIDVPDFYIKKYWFDRYVKEENEKFKNDVVKRAVNDNIQNVVSEIRDIAKSGCAVEPYTVERSGFDKLKSWIGINEPNRTVLDDLDEYDEYVSPIIKDHYNAQAEQHRELIAKQELGERNELERQKRKDELERQKVENDLKLQLELDKFEKNRPSAPSKQTYQPVEPEQKPESKRDDSLDFGM